MLTGIYIIENQVNNKKYIGSSVDIKKRWRDHVWYLRHNKHHNSHLQLAWNKYGENVFKFSILFECEVGALLVNELNAIIKHNSFNNNYGYNVNHPEHNFLNRKHSEKTKLKLSISKLGDKNPMYGKCGNKHHNYNKEVSVETKNKMSLSHKGIPTHRQTYVKLTVNEVINIREMYSMGNISQLTIGAIFNVSYGTINKIITRKTWLHI